MELELPDDIESLKAIIKKLLVEIEQLKAKNAELTAENAELRVVWIRIVEIVTSRQVRTG